jgi:hypothetical protein
MFVYNLSIKIDPAIEKEWEKWERDEHIPEVMRSGLFTDYKFYRLLEQDEREGVTYVLQYFASTAAHYKEYLEKYAPLLQEKALTKWGDKFIAFRTLMQVVN